MHELKNCPFCGAKAKLYEHDFDNVKNFSVSCTHCFASTPAANDKNFIADVWNERVNLTAQNDEGILSCPFCGHKSYLGEVEDNGKKFFCVVCEECGVTSQGSDKESDVINFWNRRV